MRNNPNPHPKPPATARGLALHVLEAVARGQYAQPTLDRALQNTRLSPEDRGLATHLTYGTLRHLRYLDHLLAPHLNAPHHLPPPVRWALRAGAYERLFLEHPAYAVVHSWVEETKRRAPRLAGLTNAVLRRVTHREAPPAVRLSIPDFLHDHWRIFFGDAGFAEGFNQPEPLWITAYPGAREALEAQGVAYRPGPVPDSLALEGARLRALEAYRQGLLQPQNPASLFAAQLLDPPPGAKVLDLAGGAGLKALYLAARGARVVSYDKNPKRQATGRATPARTGLRVAFKTQDLTRPIPETAPFVLLDAPCTGTGTFRGNPEIRYRLRPQDPQALSTLQRALLETAARAVEPGGRLVYAVCTLTEAEGEAVTRAFLEQHPEFTLEPFTPPFPALKQDLGVYVRPENGLDGFYYARFRKA